MCAGSTTITWKDKKENQSSKNRSYLPQAQTKIGCNGLCVGKTFRKKFLLKANMMHVAIVSAASSLVVHVQLSVSPISNRRTRFSVTRLLKTKPHKTLYTVRPHTLACQRKIMPLLSKLLGFFALNKTPELHTKLNWSSALWRLNGFMSVHG